MIRAVGLVALLAATASADVPKPDPCACSPNKPGFHRASALTGDWGGERAKLFEKGIKVTATYTGEVFASPGLDTPLVYAGLGSLAVDVDLAEAVAAHLGALHVQGFAIHGHGLSEELMDIYGVSNNVAPQDVRLFEAWYEQPLGPLSIRAGLLASDQEYVLASRSVVLLDATFGIAGMLSYNVFGPVYPVATPGVSATVDASPIKVRGALYDGDRINSHGIPTQIGDDAILIGEVEYDESYKLGAWHHTALGNGYYGIVDKQLARFLGMFTRVGVAPDQPIDIYVDTGFRIGPGPWRPRDFFSMGLGFAGSDVGIQTVVEATYQYLVKGWLTVQPDVQVLLDRNGSHAIFATRAVIAL